MEALIDGLKSTNGWIIAILLGVVIYLTIKMAKAGIFRFKSERVQIGLDASDKEQKVIRHQIEFVRNAIEGFERDIPKFEGYDEFRGKFILEKLFDEIINWIIFNHIEDTKSYIEVKQDIIISIIKKYTFNELYTDPSFITQVKKHVKYIIMRLIDIREEYYKD